jgi:muramidase (phage lysozyme)
MATKNQDTNLRVTQSVLEGLGIPPVQIPGMSKIIAEKAKVLQGAEGVKAARFVVGAVESGRKDDSGYSVGQGGTVITDLERGHPGKFGFARNFTQKDGSVVKTTAAGMYQITYPTWERHAKKLGIKGFTKDDQDAVFDSIAKERGAYDLFAAGKMKEGFDKLGAEFAALPSSIYKNKQGSSSWDRVNKLLQEAGAPALATPNYDGKIPYKPSAPVVSEKNVIQAMLPTPQEQMATAAQVEQDRVTSLANTFAQERSLEEQQVAQAAAARKKQIDSMIAGAFDPSGAISGNGAANQERDMLANVTELDGPLSKLIDLA